MGRKELSGLWDGEEVKSVLREPERRMEDGKNTYRERIETNLQQNNSLKEVWGEWG